MRTTLYRFSRAALLFCALLALVSLVAQSGPATAPAGGKAFFFKATAGKKTAYLFGSMHLATKDLYPLPAEVEAAFTESSALLVEADINNVDQAALVDLVTKKGLYANGDTLTKHLDAPAADALKAFCKDHKLETAFVEPMKPWLAAITLTMQAMGDLGLDGSQGVDMHFLKQAAAGKKKVTELESAGMQIALLAGLPDDLQLRWLKATLDDNKDLKGDLDKFVNAWSAGDTAAMETLMFKSLKDEPKLRTVLFDERNAEMVKGIQKALADQDTVFVVVGAGHFVGDKGLLKLLEKSGFKVEQPPVTKAASKAD